MSKEKVKKIISLILIIIWMLTIFMFSNQNGEKSQSTSRSVTKTIVKIITYNQNIIEENEFKLIENTDYIIRKLAHYSIYLLGGVLIFNYTNTFNINTKKKVVISIIVGISYAAFDELHQYFVADRSARIFDICIDSLGVITGVSLIYLKNSKIKTLKKLF